MVPWSFRRQLADRDSLACMAAPFPTREDFFAVGARELLARQVGRSPGRRVTSAAVYTTGTNVNSALAGAAAMADEVMRHTAIRFNELFLDSAEGDALGRLVADRIDPELQLKQPAPAVVDVQFVRAIPPGTTAEYTVVAGEILRTKSGIEFRTTADATFGSGANSTNVVLAEAVLAGAIGNVDAYAITEFAQAPTQAGIAIWNSENASGGADLERDRDFLARAKLSRKAARGGVYEAILLAVLSVPGVKTATVTEELDGSGDPAGIVQIYIADIAGQANAALVERVRRQLIDARCAGIVPRVRRTSVLNFVIEYTAAVLPGYDRTVIADQLRTITVATVNQLKPGETLRRSMLFSLIRSIPGFIVTDNTVTNPSTDHTPLPEQNIKTDTTSVIIGS